jgi:hypothetical protein
MNAIRLAVLLAVTAAAAPALGQEAETPAAATPVAAVDLTCADISTLEAAHAAALVYYIAGYIDSQRDAGAPPPPPADNGMPGGITLSASAIIDACGADPSALIRDVITAQGGSSAPPAAAPPAQETAPAEEPAPAEEAAPTEQPPAEQPTEPAPEGSPPPASP